MSLTKKNLEQNAQILLIFHNAYPRPTMKIIWSLLLM